MNLLGTYLSLTVWHFTLKHWPKYYASDQFPHKCRLYPMNRKQLTSSGRAFVTVSRHKEMSTQSRCLPVCEYLAYSPSFQLVIDSDQVFMLYAFQV